MNDNLPIGWTRSPRNRDGGNRGRITYAELRGFPKFDRLLALGTGTAKTVTFDGKKWKSLLPLSYVRELYPQLTEELDKLHNMILNAIKLNLKNTRKDVMATKTRLKGDRVTYKQLYCAAFPAVIASYNYEQSGKTSDELAADIAKITEEFALKAFR